MGIERADKVGIITAVKEFLLQAFPLVEIV